MEKTQWKYKIGSGKTPVVLSLIMLAIFGGVTGWLYSENNGAFFFTGLFSAILLALVIATVYRLAFFKVLIGKAGFYYQTGPGNGKFYAYTQVEKPGSIPVRHRTEPRKITATLRFPVCLSSGFSSFALTKKR